MDLKNTSISTQSKISNKTLMYLMREDNLRELEIKDRDKILNIKRSLDYIFYFNLVLISSVYCLTNYFLIRKIKTNFLNRVVDFSFVSGISYLGSFYAYKINLQNNSKDMKYLKTKYSLMIKNTISLSNNRENNQFNILNLHTKYHYSQLNFLFLLMLRLLI